MDGVGEVRVWSLEFGGGGGHAPGRFRARTLGARLHTLSRAQQHPTQYRAEGFRELDVNRRLLEESARAAERLIDHLVGEDEVARLELVAQAADGARGDDVRYAEFLEREEV